MQWNRGRDGLGWEGGWGEKGWSVKGDEGTLKRQGHELGKAMARGTASIPCLLPFSPSRVQRLLL